MSIRTYHASSMQEALELVRRDLGPDASVLHTRQVPTSWWSRLAPKLFGPKRIEVTASAEVEAPSRLPQAANASRSARTNRPPRQKPPTQAAGIEELQKRTHAPRRRRSPSASRRWTDALFRLYAELVDAEAPEDLARSLVDRVRRILPRALQRNGRQTSSGDIIEVRRHLARLLERQFPAAGEIALTPPRCRVAALVGPTGVGKTTTIAKLAANFHLRDRKRVGLITIDTFRVAAAEQLESYAQIIKLPMETAADESQLRDALSRMRGFDLVLIDTAGQGPTDENGLRRLQSILENAQVHETHLVLSADCSSASLMKTTRRFAPVGVTSLLLTKLDETTGLGALLPLLLSAHLPMSYITTGQNVPDDIESASSRKLSELIAGIGSP